MLTLKKNKKTGGGAFGSYYPLGNGKGVKILNSDWQNGDAYFFTIAEAKESDQWYEAKEEARLLRKSAKSGIVPKCYGAKVIRMDDGTYTVGIVMQHLGIMTLHKKIRGFKKRWKIIERLENKLSDIGIQHQDLHPHNVMNYKGKWYAIDFSMSCIEEGFFDYEQY